MTNLTRRSLFGIGALSLATPILAIPAPASAPPAGALIPLDLAEVIAAWAKRGDEADAAWRAYEANQRPELALRFNDHWTAWHATYERRNEAHDTMIRLLHRYAGGAHV